MDECDRNTLKKTLQLHKLLWLMVEDRPHLSRRNWGAGSRDLAEEHIVVVDGMNKADLDGRLRIECTEDKQVSGDKDQPVCATH